MRWIAFILHASIVCVSSIVPCGHFLFPHLNDSSLTEQENTTLNLTFKVIYDLKNCSGLNLFYILVTKVTSYSEIKCSMLHVNGQCQESMRMPKCACPSKHGDYNLVHKINRSDNSPTTWVWSTNNGVLEDNYITFNALYPGRVLDLLIGIGEHEYLQNVTVDPDCPLNVTCFYDEGNPPVTARLLDRHGVEMEGSIYSRGQIRYRFPAVGCQDAGLIRCEAPGASHNKSALILVKCSPALSFGGHITDQSETSSVLINARVHTNDFQECTLSELTDQATNGPNVLDLKAQDSAPDVETILNCLSNMSSTGTPPDIEVTVYFHNAHTTNGRWRLQLTNDVGTGQLDLDLHDVLEFERPDTTSWTIKTVRSDPATSEGKTETGGSSFPRENPATLVSTPTQIAAIAAIVLIVGIITIGIVVVLLKKGTTYNGAQAAPVSGHGLQDAFVHWRAIPRVENRSSTSSNKSSNPYDEVQDRSMPIERAPPRPHKRHCQAPREFPDDYLHPAATSSDLQGTAAAASDDTESNYRNCSSTPLDNTQMSVTRHFK